MISRLSPGYGGVDASRRGLRLAPGWTGRHGLRDDAVDVRLDGHRVWSFRPRSDALRTPLGRFVAWPERLVPHLVGRTTLSLVAHADGRVLHEAEVAFTDADRRTHVADAAGHLLTVDKGGRLQRMFDRTDDAVRGHVVDAVTVIVDQLRDEAGLEAFLAFGCLLGAVRDGRMIGHDADADIAYLSRHDHPLDVIRENRRACRVMQDLGHRVVRMSDADFKIWVPLPDGRRCGVDVFAGYHLGGAFHLLPTVRGEVRREDLLPTGTVRLEGREVVAPARPEVLLAATYGESWRTPDPSFRFTQPADLDRHMDGYWRGARQGLNRWTEFYDSPRAGEVPTGPSDFARWVHRRLRRAGDTTGGVADIGAGTGRDAIWFARRGRPAVALDAAHRARVLTRRAARRAGQTVDVRRLNLNDAATVLAEGARIAHEGRVRHAYARLLADELEDAARGELLRFSRMVTRRGGRLFLEVRRDGPRLARAVAAQGGRVVHEEPGPGTRRYVAEWR
ncbi:class I SAM-dependent methyltransferase [Nocardioides iriomotensis]|uniref:Class I SAM-dependent methyltransferase n=1 Tax=Nocardioides iriomotensis TaxID=715784 RepID=A0A4Q5J653_9ACTN|nr:class I SAM-dependent methyltransferase [Nocardioides iriomotensis]RYU14112.1 class I SAM-dependent methyltransferase [Nocardioides iriomotensis]